jgi:hypothetical protein
MPPRKPTQEAVPAVDDAPPPEGPETAPPIAEATAQVVEQLKEVGAEVIAEAKATADEIIEAARAEVEKVKAHVEEIERGATARIAEMIAASAVEPVGLGVVDGAPGSVVEYIPPGGGRTRRAIITGTDPETGTVQLYVFDGADVRKGVAEYVDEHGGWRPLPA